MHLSTLQKEKWALVGLLHPYISTPSTVTHLQPSHSYSWTVTHPFNCHSLNHHTLTIHPHHHTLHPSPYTLYLMVESSDPVTMTLSSYCRHPTGIVWPRSSVVMFRYSRYQICTESARLNAALTSTSRGFTMAQGWTSLKMASTSHSTVGQTSKSWECRWPQPVMWEGTHVC